MELRAVQADEREEKRRVDECQREMERVKCGGGGGARGA